VISKRGAGLRKGPDEGSQGEVGQKKKQGNVGREQLFRLAGFLNAHLRGS